MDYELSARILIGVLLLTSIVMLILKTRKKKPAKLRRHVDRVSARRSGTPKKEEKPAAPILPFYNVERPGLFVYTDDKGRTHLLLQRAQLTDEAYFRTLTEDETALSAFDPIVAHINALNVGAQSGLCTDVYTVNFGQADKQPEEELSVRAMNEHGLSMGDPFKEPISVSLIEKLQKLTKSNGIDRDLRMAMDRECLGLDKALSRASLFLNDEKKAEWNERLSELKGFITAEDKTAFVSQIDNNRTTLHQIADRLDDEMKKLSQSMKDLASTDVALTRAIPLIEERELTVRSLFLLSMIKVAKDESYFAGLQSSTRLEKNAKAFPSAQVFLDKARHVIFDLAEKFGREMKEEELALLGQVKKEIEELHTEAVAARSRLREESGYLQVVVDDYLIHRDMPERYALKINDKGRVSALLVLHRH